MKLLLHEFIDWCESTHFRRCACGAAFERGLPPLVVMKAEVALEWALATNRPVELFTATVSARALLAGMIFRRSRVSVKNIFQADLDDSAFDRLKRSLGEISRSGLKIVEGEPPLVLRGAAFLSGPLAMVTACSY